MNKPKTATLGHQLWRLENARATEVQALAELERFPHWIGHANTPGGVRRTICAGSLRGLLVTAAGLPQHYQSLRVERRGQPKCQFGRFNSDRWIKI